MISVLIKKYNTHYKNFHKLRWINLKEDDFTNLPEFQRITRKFADYINHIDEWLKEE
mgnify:CR=1 FL=1